MHKKVFILSIILVNLSLLSCNQGKNNAGSFSIKPFNVKGLDTLKTASGLKYILVKANSKGNLPVNGKEVAVHYTGFFTNGKVFDSSVQRGAALPFTIGVGRVIKGWDEGIALLHEGEKARLIVPYDLGYGIDGSGSIPPMSTLIFDVELIKAAQ
jgi:FKBP-type peptidyl-prolyl cis-trans isomerase